ncbi:MAG: hypothetical protein JNK73_13830 [Bacteroidia bacterium]|nr:hypothetical protein [Bacteroidia bacterium]
MLAKNIVSIALALLFSAFISFSIHFFASGHLEQWFYIPLGFAFFFFIYNFVYTYRSTKEEFTQFLLFSLALKLLLAFFTLLLCAFLFRSSFSGFAFHFVSTYMVFTVFEIRFLNQLIRNKPQTTPPNQ